MPEEHVDELYQTLKEVTTAHIKDSLIHNPETLHMPLQNADSAKTVVAGIASVLDNINSDFTLRTDGDDEEQRTIIQSAVSLTPYMSGDLETASLQKSFKEQYEYWNSHRTTKNARKIAGDTLQAVVDLQREQDSSNYLFFQSILLNPNVSDRELAAAYSGMAKTDPEVALTSLPFIIEILEKSSLPSDILQTGVHNLFEAYKSKPDGMNVLGKRIAELSLDAIPLYIQDEKEDAPMHNTLTIQIEQMQETILSFLSGLPDQENVAELKKAFDNAIIKRSAHDIYVSETEINQELVIKASEIFQALQRLGIAEVGKAARDDEHDDWDNSKDDLGSSEKEQTDTAPFSSQDAYTNVQNRSVLQARAIELLSERLRKLTMADMKYLPAEIHLTKAFRIFMKDKGNITVSDDLQNAWFRCEKQSVNISWDGRDKVRQDVLIDKDECVYRRMEHKIDDNNNYDYAQEPAMLIEYGEVFADNGERLWESSGLTRKRWQTEEQILQRLLESLKEVKAIPGFSTQMDESN